MVALVKYLGLADYASTYEAMRSFTKERTADTPDEIWILEHPPVFTLGLAGDAGNLHSPSNQIPLVQVDRGGEITYHGPGQIVVYLLLDLRRLGIFVKELDSSQKMNATKSMSTPSQWPKGKRDKTGFIFPSSCVLEPLYVS